MVGLKKSGKEPDNVEVIEEKTVKGKLPPEKQSSTPKVPQSGKVGEKENNSGNKNEVNDIDKTGKPRSPPDTEKPGNKTGSKLPKLQLATRQLLSEVIEGENSKPTSVPKVAQFGKRLCSWCNKPVLGDEHFHCDTCNICCLGHQAFEQHILGKDHALKFVKKVPEAKPSEDPKPVSPPADSQPPSDFPMCHGTGCDRKFVSIPALKKHIHEFHGFLIKCKECVSMGQTPAEVLTCQELIDHYADIHNTTIKEYDIKFYGTVNNSKQGYVRCKLCIKHGSKIKLGGPGLWFANIFNHEAVLRAHFKTHHPSLASNTGTIMSQVVLGCQLCTQEFSSSSPTSWQNHLSIHGDKSSDVAEEASSATVENIRGNASNLVTSFCAYCGESVVNTGNAMQTHIRKEHFGLSFRCKMCKGDKDCFDRLQGVEKHLERHHYDVGKIKAAQVEMPGDKKSVGGFAWVKCKRPGCGYTGIGIGAETLRHQAKKHNDKSRSLQHFNIFCRICSDPSKQSSGVIPQVFDDASDFSEHMSSYHKVLFDLLPDPQ